ncbi:unnamed protein product [Oppiella nova]|uniref:DUF7789 domain-containing protein n=1 Tax=Oppiella nova TaxID=334625 RepID=A0A7R9QPH9_9ACAR|nr:unnamed protein product [Oppiella nova]CAG2169585.1 unnamed protein product [Oppiella nova]
MRRYWRSKALIYRTVGAQITMQEMCEKLFIAQSLMIFELQLAASSLILWLRNGVEDWTPVEVVVVSIGTVVTILWLILGYLAYIRDENDELLQNSVFVSGSIALVIRVITIGFMIIVMNNFNKGLKQKVDPYETTPTKVAFPFTISTNGPPESP